MHRKMGLGECTQMFAVKVGFCELLSYSYLNFKTFFDEIKMHTGSGHWWLTPIILVTQEAKIKRIKVQSPSGKIVRETLCRKNPAQNRAGGEAQAVRVVDLVASKCEALSSNLSVVKKKCMQEMA
jgi:hypothetical protein